MTRVDVLVFAGVDDLDAVAPLEVLDKARRLGASLTARTVTVDDRSEVLTRCGLRLAVQAAWSPDQADVVLVPGGGYTAGEGSGVRAELRSGQVPAALREAVRPDLVFASVCTGALLLASAGLLEGRPCTTHHRAIADLESAGGRYVAARVVDDGDLITAGGVTSGLDLGLRLVERYASVEIALAVEHAMEYERRGTVWQRGERR